MVNRVSALLHTLVEANYNYPPKDGRVLEVFWSIMLSPKQINTLRAAVDRIIPQDDYPGGWEAGVGDYLARQFERDLKDMLRLYTAGLDALDAEAHALYTNDFAALDTASQDALLSRLEQGHVMTPWPIPPAQFFDLLVNHAIEGYYSDPGNGGNRKGTAWAMIGFEVTG